VLQAVLAHHLDLMILEVFSSLNDSMILWLFEEGVASVSHVSAPRGYQGLCCSSPQEHGGWGCPVHPPQPSWDAAQSGLR